MKYDWRKQEKGLYSPGEKPAAVNVPAQKYIMISGKGNPNHEDFSNRVGALYSLAYSIKMRYKAEHKEMWRSFPCIPWKESGIWRKRPGHKPMCWRIRNI